MSAPRSLLRVLTAASLATAVGCASAPTLTTAPDPARMYGAVAHRTAFEMGAQEPAAAGPAGGSTSGGGPAAGEGPAGGEGPAAGEDAGDGQPVAASGPVTGPAPRQPSDVTEPHKGQGARTGVFWAGIATTIVGAAMLTGFGIGGRVTQAQLKKGYDEGDLTYAREDELRDRGTAFNQVAAAGAGITIVGAAVAAIVYGIDYSRCGTLAKRRKDCKSSQR